MPPKAQMSTARRGRPAKGAAPVTALSASTRRGRVAKTNTSDATTVEPPKKCGRQAKTEANKPIAQIDDAIKRGRRSVAAAKEAVADAPAPTQKRAGRPAKATETVVATAGAPKKRGRPPKQDAAAEAPATPKRRGRHALDLNRVAGSSRVAKRASPRSKSAVAPRINPKMRSRLRQRAGPVEKVKETVQPIKKARGRPKKVELEVKAPVPKKAVGRSRKTSAPIPAAPAKKVTARPKTAAPRKRRGYTSFEVADRFVAQVKQFIANLQAEDAANAAAAAGEADDEGEEVDIEVELGPEVGVTGSSANFLENDEEREAIAELGEDDGEMLVDPADSASEMLTDQELLARDEEAVDEVALENDRPEFAAAHNEVHVQNTNQDDAHMAGTDQPELERQSSAGSVSIDLHRDITETISIPQVDGSNEVHTEHTHTDKHIHEHSHVPGFGAATSLFGGF